MCLNLYSLLQNSKAFLSIHLWHVQSSRPAEVDHGAEAAGIGLHPVRGVALARRLRGGDRGEVDSSRPETPPGHLGPLASLRLHHHRVVRVKLRPENVGCGV